MFSIEDWLDPKMVLLDSEPVFSKLFLFGVPSTVCFHQTFVASKFYAEALCCALLCPCVGAPHSQNLGVKEFRVVPRGKGGGFVVKFIAATFPWKLKGENLRSFSPNVFCVFRARQPKRFVRISLS